MRHAIRVARWQASEKVIPGRSSWRRNFCRSADGMGFIGSRCWTPGWVVDSWFGSCLVCFDLRPEYSSKKLPPQVVVFPVHVLPRIWTSSTFCAWLGCDRWFLAGPMLQSCLETQPSQWQIKAYQSQTQIEWVTRFFSCNFSCYINQLTISNAFWPRVCLTWFWAFSKEKVIPQVSFRLEFDLSIIISAHLVLFAWGCTTPTLVLEKGTGSANRMLHWQFFRVLVVASSPSLAGSRCIFQGFDSVTTKILLCGMYSPCDFLLANVLCSMLSSSSLMGPCLLRQHLLNVEIPLHVSIRPPGPLQPRIFFCPCWFSNGQTRAQGLQIFSPTSWRVFERPMARASIVGLTLALAAVGSCFLGGVPTQPARAPPVPSHVESLGAAPTQSQSEGGYLGYSLQQKWWLEDVGTGEPFHDDLTQSLFDKIWGRWTSS